MTKRKIRQDMVGLIHCEPDQCYPGYTLFCGGSPSSAYLIDLEGRICHRWTHARGIRHAKLLASGNLLCRAAPSSEVAGQRGLVGQTPAVFELDWDSNLVWEYCDDWLHHDYERLASGNTLLIAWRPMPEDLSRRVQGGYRTEEEIPQLLGDVVLEVTPDGQVASEWRSWEYLDPDIDIICPIEYRREWTHCNSISTTPDGQWVVSLRRIDTVAVVDPASGQLKWRWGPGIVAHQHDARFLANGHLLVFDNGVHKRNGSEFSRVLEVDPATGESVWEYQADPPFLFFSFMNGGAERLPNGNTLICHSALGRFFEVTPRSKIVWEYVNPFFQPNSRLGGRHNITFRANRYGPEHEALADKDLSPERYARLNRW